MLTAKLGWDKAQSSLNNTIISTCGIVGLIIGALTSSMMVVIGRRLLAIILSLSVVISMTPTLIWVNLYLICGCRLIFGFCGGAIVTCASLILIETVPKEKAALFSSTINLGIIFGVMICLFCGLPLIAMSDAELKTTDIWMITNAAPLVLCTLNIVLFLTVFREEPLEFLLSNERSDDAVKVIKRLYQTENADELYL